MHNKYRAVRKFYLTFTREKFPYTVYFTDKLEEVNERRDWLIHTLCLLKFSRGS